MSSINLLSNNVVGLRLCSFNKKWLHISDQTVSERTILNQINALVSLQVRPLRLPEINIWGV